MSDGTVLMSAEEIDRALSRIAHQVLEFTGGTHDLALVGIHTRGVPLARRLAWKIAQTGEVAPPVGILDINLYRDDLSTRSADHPVVRKTDVPFRITERQVVLVDDVLFTGRTIRAAMDALTDLGRPRAIRLAVLVDRGGRELPIQPDFSGRSVTVQPEQTIEVRLAESDGGPDQVLLRSRAEVLARRAEARGRLAALRTESAHARPRRKAAEPGRRPAKPRRKPVDKETKPLPPHGPEGGRGKAGRGRKPARTRDRKVKK